MSDDTRPMLGQVDADSLVERISARVREGVEDSFDKKSTRFCRNSMPAYLKSTFTMKLSEVESKLETALDKIDDLENRSRRCNIRVVGLPEGSEGTNPVAFFRTWLPELLEMNAKGGSVKLDRCHRALTRRPPPGQRPRAVILKLHNFQDKVRIMQAARKAQSLAYNGAPIIFRRFLRGRYTETSGILR
ncbi:hypothetical protein D5F01_LYC10957 [Larimichthys crocea]|uniref:LINE-1 type transposase domain-containing protein 1 n=1 Tax=Larimichthys crocea TaxID=215358 RepID=A0A6G0IIH8_LARCR|nr:hypothetical protein D5F01_LYC10957 [Larimichthys crocea]